MTLVACTRFATMSLSTFTAGVRTVVRIEPMFAPSCCICMARILVWFAQESWVFAKSPEAMFRAFMTY